MIYACLKYQGEPPVLNKQYTLKKMKDNKIKQVLPGDEYQGD
jgi:hypothetical protein